MHKLDDILRESLMVMHVQPSVSYLIMCLL